ncbi:MAG: carboxypeptidase regulatory-like domain-containing protein [Planctomycetes bacterium]|nr:carboxypeptidase regulatory-like domain-containing protein [Planctomycetota bacterium]
MQSLRSPLIVLAVLVIVGLLAWLALRTTPQRFEVTRPDDEASTPRLETSQARRVQVSPSAVDPSNGKDGRDQRTEAPGLEGPDARPGPRLRIIDALTRESVPGAHVGFMARNGRGARARRFASYSMDETTDLERWGRVLRSDEDGRCALPFFTGFAEVMVWADDRRSPGELLDFSESVGQVTEIAIEPVHDIQVEVVSESGRGMPQVAVVLCADSRHPGLLNPQTRALTDDTGNVRFRRAASEVRLGGPSGLTLQLALLGDHGPSVPVVHGMTHRLVHPGSFPAQLVARPAGPDEIDSAAEVLFTLSSRSDESRGGYQVIGPASGVTTTLPAGVAIRVGARLLDDTHATGFAEAGPFETDSTQTIVVPLGPRRLQVTGLATDERGRPVGNALLEMEIHATDEDGNSEATEVDGLWTDEFGRFRVGLEDAPANHVQLSGSVTCWHRPGFPENEGPVHAQVAELARSESTIDFGRFVLAAPEALVSGVVVDETGRPWPDALVRLTEGDAAPRDFGVEGPRARTNAQGRFVIRASPTGGALHVLVTHDLALPTWQGPFEIGTDGLTIVLPRGRTLDLRVLRDEGVSPGSLNVVLIGRPALREVLDPDGYDLRRKPSVHAEFLGEGRYRFAGLRPGSARLEFRLAESSRALAFAIDEVEVPESGTCRDPRLDPVDLRGRLFTLQLRVRGAEGPLENARVSTRIDEKRFSVMTDAEGLATLVAPAPIDELSVSCHGFRNWKGYEPRSVVEVRLEPAPRVRFEVPGVTRWLTRPFWVHGVAIQKGIDRTEALTQLVSFNFAEDGSAEVIMPAPGDWDLNFSLDRTTRNASSSSSEWPAPLPTQSIFVGEGLPTQTIALQHDPTLLDAALRFAAERR